MRIDHQNVHIVWVDISSQNTVSHYSGRTLNTCVSVDIKPSLLSRDFHWMDYLNSSLVDKWMCSAKSLPRDRRRLYVLYVSAASNFSLLSVVVVANRGAALDWEPVCGQRDLPPIVATWVALGRPD